MPQDSTSYPHPGACKEEKRLILRCDMGGNWELGTPVLGGRGCEEVPARGRRGPGS